MFPIQNRQKIHIWKVTVKQRSLFLGLADFFKEAKRIANFGGRMNSSVRIMKRKGEWTSIKKETRMGEER